MWFYFSTKYKLRYIVAINKYHAKLQYFKYDKKLYYELKNKYMKQSATSKIHTLNNI